MKRMLGKFLVAVLLSGGAVMVAASPSTALPRDPCMDQTNYELQHQWYEDQAMAYFDTWAAWMAADHYVNPLTGLETWAANTSSGVQYVYSLTDYTNRVNTAAYNSQWADGQLRNFEDTANVCP